MPVSVDGETIATLTVGKILARFADEYRASTATTMTSPRRVGDRARHRRGRYRDPRAARARDIGRRCLVRLAARREAYSARKGAQVSFAVYMRDRLKPGMIFVGPCLIEEKSATTVVDVDARVTIDRYGSLDIAVGSTE